MAEGRHLKTLVRAVARQFRRKWRHEAVLAALALSLSVGTTFFFITRPGQLLEYWVQKECSKVRGVRTPPAEIVLVTIDDETYKQLKVNPAKSLPRRFVAAAIEEMLKANPKAVIIDLAAPKDDGEPEADAYLEKVLRAGPTTIWDGELPNAISAGSSPESASGITFGSDERFRSAARMELPMLLSVRYGVVAPIRSSKESPVLYEQVPLSRPLIELANIGVIAPGSDDQINFYGPPGTIETLSLYQLIGASPDQWRKRLENKIVFVGVQAAKIKDDYPVTASDSPMFGVEIHATIAGNLIDRSWLRRDPLESEVRNLFLATLLLAAIGLRLRPAFGAFCIGVFGALSLFGEYRAFADHQRWIGGIGALLVAMFVLIVINAIYFLKRRDESQRNFERLVDFKVAD